MKVTQQVEEERETKTIDRDRLSNRDKMKGEKWRGGRE